MKRTLLLVIISLTMAVAFVGCATVGSVTTTTPSGTPEVADDASNSENTALGGTMGLANPLVEYDSFDALMDAMPNVIMHDVPSGASNVVYQQITGVEPPIAEIIFDYEGCDYCYRAAFSDDAYSTDISGVYTEFNETNAAIPASGATDGGTYTLFYDKESPEALASWYYEPAHCQYSLYTTTGHKSDDSIGIYDVIDVLLPLKTDVDGNELDNSSLDENAEVTLLMANAKNGLDLAGNPWNPNEVTGTVVNVGNNSIVINMENGNTLTFLLTYISSTAATAGDNVTIKYTGDVIDAPQAVEIVVNKKADVSEHTISGYITQFDSKEVYIKTTTNNVYGFKLVSSTKYTGKASALKIGYDVELTYKGNITNTPDAIKINITATNREVVDPLANKTLNGVVTKLKSKSVTIVTDSNRTYTFKKSSATEVSGAYTLAVGATIKVTYDGYASKSPLAKKIKVLAPDDPTPPSPTPTATPAPAVVTKTIVGTIISHQGNTLEVYTDSAARYSFVIAGAEVYGDSNGNVGDYATVTYRQESGGFIVTKVVYKAVFTPTPAPVVTEYTVSGTVTLYSGYVLEIMTYTGYRYTFYIAGAKITGNSYGAVGDDATITYRESSGNQTVTKVVFTQQYQPDPTPYYKEYTVAGYITDYHGNMLEMETSSGIIYDFLIYAPVMSGDDGCGVGDKVKVTYYLNEWGEMTVVDAYFTKVLLD